ncbi:MAG: multidrug resistance efflux pump [Oceanicoccus sp.]|jgi:multidrug resistance efflux pump
MKINFRSIPKSNNPIIDDGVKVLYGKAKREGYRGRWYMLLGLVLAPIILVCWIFLRPHIFVLAPALITTDPLEIRAPGMAIISEIKIMAGKTVKEGELLMRLTDSTIDAQVNVLEHQLSLLLESSEPTRAAIIKGMNQRIALAESGMKRQDEFLNSFESYRKQGVVPTANMAAVVQAHTAASMVLEQAKADLVKEQYSQKAERQAGALTQRRQHLELELARLQAQKDKLDIRSPYATKVSAVVTQSGEKVSEDQSLLWLTGRTNPVVVAYLDPRYLKYVEMGQKANVRLPDGRRFRAVINEPTELVAKVPNQLTGPFDGEKPALKVTLTPEKPITTNIEGLPVEVSFDYLTGPFNWLK